MKKLMLCALLSTSTFTSHHSSKSYTHNREYTRLEFSNSVNIFKKSVQVNNFISGSVKIFVIPKNKMTFEVSRERPTKYDFYLNSNFFSEEGPLGLVVIDGKRVSNRVSKGGYFYVKGGKASVSTVSAPRKTEFNSQTILAGIRNGRINHELVKKVHAKDKNYRSLVGEDRKGNIIVVVSSFLGLVTIDEMIKIGKDFDVYNGVLFDGGSSVDFRLSSNNNTHHFKSVPGFVKEYLGIQEPTTYICGNFIQQ